MDKMKFNPLTRTNAPKSRYYIDPTELSCEVQKSQELSACTDRLGEMLLEITEKVYNLPKY